MKRLLCILLALCLAIGIIPFSNIANITPKVDIANFTRQVQSIKRKYKDEPVSNTIIVKSKHNIPALDSVAIAEGYDNLHIVQFDNSSSAEKALEYYNDQRLIEYAEADMTVSTCETTGITYDTHLSWGSENIGVDDYIDYLGDVSTLPEVVVGIIDTGIDLDHEFLQDRIIPTGFNLSGSGSSTSENDDNGHGTHVAGIVADNSTDNVKIKAYKVLDSNGSGSTVNIMNAIQNAISENVNVINMSLGSRGQSSAMSEVVNVAVKKGITVCVAAGNSGADANNYSPACIENCITVAAMDEESDFPDWTNWGSCVDIIAPGVSIYSTYQNNSYETLSGTSMATPFVTAASALLLSTNKRLKPNEVCQTLQENGRDCAPPEKLKDKKRLYIGSASQYNSERTSTPTISVPSGYYEDSIVVEILCDDIDAKIYYTTDGTRASESNGILYEEPIVIDKITSLHVSAYAPNKLKSLQVYETYYISYIDDENNFSIDSNGIITRYAGSSTYLIIPDKIKGITVTGIGNNVFYNSNMIRITFPDTLTYIGDYAFFNSQSLVSVRGKNIKTINSHGFDSCRSLTDINLSNVEEIGRFGCYAIPVTSFYNDKVEFIDEYSFYNCKKLLSINLTNVKELAKNAFGFCSNLENATFPNLEIIGNHTFNSALKMKSFDAPKVTMIGIQAFYHTKKLDEIYFPNLQGEIPSKAFENSSIKKANFGNITAINKNALNYCKNLKSLYIPKVETISSDALNHCESLNAVFAPNLKSTLSLPNHDNVNVYLSSDCISLPNIDNRYSVIAPSGSYAETWAEENGYIFLDSESCSFTDVESDSFIYTCSTNNEVCTMPIDLVKQIWEDYNPINESKDFITHGFLLDVVPEDIINAKDFARINNCK